MSDPFDQIPPEGETLSLPPPREPEPEPQPEPLDEKKLAERMEKLLNMLASENENERAVAASKIGALAGIMKMPVYDALRKLLGVSAPAPVDLRSTPDPAEAAAYTAAGVPKNERKHKAPRHNIDRLEEAYKANADKMDPPLEPGEHRDIGWVLECDFDWQLDRWQIKFVRSMTKRLLSVDAEPLV